MLAAKHADVSPALVRIEVKAVKQNRISSNGTGNRQLDLV